MSSFSATGVETLPVAVDPGTEDFSGSSSSSDDMDIVTGKYCIKKCYVASVIGFSSNF